MNEYSSRTEGDGIPLLTEVVAVPDTGAELAPAATPSAVPLHATESASLAKDSLYELAAAPASLDQDRLDAVLREFRDTWPDIIETECRDAVQLALQQIAVQMTETLTANLSVALQMRLEAWLEERLRG